MFYRVEILANFPDKPPNLWLKRIRDYFLANAITINPGQPNEQISFVTYEHCYHDEQPTWPCDVIEHHETPS